MPAHSEKSVWEKIGAETQWLAYLLPNPAAPGSIPSIPKKFSEEKIVDVAGQWLENVDWTHLEPANGKLELQNKIAFNQIGLKGAWWINWLKQCAVWGHWKYIMATDKGSFSWNPKISFYWLETNADR